jgi:glycosyltransferase involved in cell wall biosynthesis
MRILMLNHNVIWRSTFHRCFQFARPIVRMGHEVTLVTNSPSERVRFRESVLEGVRIVESPDLFWGRLRTGWDPLNALRRAVRLFHEPYHVIHEFDSRPTVILPSMWMRSHRGVTVSDWGDWWGRGGAIADRPDRLLNRLFEPIETFFEERFRLRCDAMVTVSTALRDRAIALGMPPERVEVIANGAAVDEIAELPQAECRAKLGLPADAPVVTFSGFVLYDLELAVRSFLRLRERLPQAVMLITGARADLSALSPPAGAVVQTGLLSRSDLNAALCASDLHILPLKDTLANRARFPGKLGDYLASGRPVITNPVGDAAAIVERHELGVLAAPDPESMAARMAELLGNRERCRILGQRARRYAVEEFSWQALSRRLIDRYRRCLERKKAI